MMNKRLVIESRSAVLTRAGILAVLGLVLFLRAACNREGSKERSLPKLSRSSN